MKKIILLLSATFILSCNNDEPTLETPQPNPATSSYDKGATANRNFSGLILDTSGNAVSNASVTIGSTTVQTNASGLFIANNASVNEKFAHIKVSKVGFIDGSRVMLPTLGDNRINIMLIPDTPTATITSGVPSQVSLSNGTTVKFSGSFKDAAGNAYNGNVQVGLYHLKPSNTYLSEIMPGSLLASNTAGEAKILETFGMIHVDLKGSGGQKLNLANGTTAEISLDIDASQATTSPTTIPLWSFDEVSGIWKEEGTATKVGNKYVGNVSHFSWWNCDARFNQANLNVTVTNTAGAPISNLVVTIVRASQTYGANGTTNSSGQVTGIVPANETLTLKVTDFCGNVIYTSNIGPFTTGSSNNLPTISLTPTTISTITINGTLKTCSNANVTNGLVRLKNPNAINYFNQIVQTVTNGSFSFVTNICGTSQQFNLLGEDYTNLQTTTPITFTAKSPITNIGVISICNSVNEFITYQIDNNPVNYIITGINAGIGNPISASGLFINTPQNTPYFRLMSNSNLLATYSTPSFSISFSSNSGTIIDVPNSFSNTVQLVVNQVGAVGGYIDFTINGSYTTTSGNHTISGTGHVIRDN